VAVFAGGAVEKVDGTGGGGGGEESAVGRPRDVYHVVVNRGGPELGEVHACRQGSAPVGGGARRESGRRVVSPRAAGMRRTSHIAHATEAEIGGGAARCIAAAGIDAVAVAVARVAKITAAAHDTPGFRRVGLVGTSGVSAQGGRARIGVGCEKIPTPLPDVSGHLVEAVGIGTVAFCGSGAEVPVGEGILGGKDTLPDVHAMFALRLEIVAPRVALLVKTAAGGVFPFGLGGEAFSGPGAVGDGVVPRHVDDWMVAAVFEVGAGPLGAAPGSAIDAAPPLAADDPHALGAVLAGGREVAEKDEGPAKALGFGAVAGGVDEGVELVVGDGGGVHPERR